MRSRFNLEYCEYNRESREEDMREKKIRRFSLKIFTVESEERKKSLAARVAKFESWQSV